MSAFYPNLRVDRTLERFRRRHPEDYEIVESFAMDLLVQGISEMRVSSYVSFLVRILDIAGKRLLPKLRNFYPHLHVANLLTIVGELPTINGLLFTNNCLDNIKPYYKTAHVQQKLDE